MISYQVFLSQTLTFPSQPEVKNKLDYLSGVVLTQLIQSSCAFDFLNLHSPNVFQNQICLLIPPLMICLLSTVKFTESKSLVYPLNNCFQQNLLRSQSLNVWSQDAEIQNWLFEDKHISWIKLECPFNYL